jgi:hypothetical protein
MATTTRAKFYVEQVTEYSSFKGKEIKMRPVYSQDPESENKKFWDATPNGNIVLSIANPEGAAIFMLGREYYVDFTPADSE